MQHCPECQAVVDDEAIFCDQCGHRLKPPLGPGATTFTAPPPPAPDTTGTQSACPTCGYVNLPNELFC
ncbi:MAG: zinc ribbon domain-containing protein, partial [Anaerolineales bacterium]|nr:zinc ribbon domain-containing protein [Anaerolineales bacterium]